MTSSPHRIRRQHWMVRTSNTVDAFELRQRLRVEWFDALLPAFERAFDEAVGQEEVVRIPKIELHFKLSSSHQITGVLPEQIYRRLGEQLLELCGEKVAINGKLASWKISSARQDGFDALLRYLRTGSVPWETGWRAAGDLAAALKETYREHATTLHVVLSDGRANAALWFRLFHLVSAPEAAAIVHALLKNESISAAWKLPLQELVLALLDSGEQCLGRHMQLQLAAAFVSEALSPTDGGIPLDPMLPDGRRVSSVWTSPAFESFTASLPPAVGVLLRRDRKSGRNNAERVARRPAAIVPAARASETEMRSQSPQPLAGQTSVFPSLQTTQPSPGPKAEDSFALLVSYCGLVLLHPFLSVFFEGIGVKEPGNPQIADSALAHAAALLHFIATGSEDVYEFDLAFVKVLLGLQLESPLCVAPGLIGDGDRQECEGLCQAAVTHWTALGKTSTAGFRNSFLNRSGLLRAEEYGWRLNIERVGFDVLLDRLPWSISVVKCPWMKQPIHVEW